MTQLNIETLRKIIDNLEDDYLVEIEIDGVKQTIDDIYEVDLTEKTITFKK